MKKDELAQRKLEARTRLANLVYYYLNQEQIDALGERTYRCEVCGHVQDRDENAADNLANAVGYTVQMRALSTEIEVADFEGDQERAIGLLLQMEELVDDELFHRSRRLKSREDCRA